MKMKIGLFVSGFSFAFAAVGATRFTAGTAAGRRLLREAVVIEETDPAKRVLEENVEDIDLGSLYFQFEGCSTYQDHGQDYKEYWQNYNNNRNYNNANNRNYNNNGYNYNNNGGRDLANYNQYNNNNNNNVNTVNLVRFRLCKDSSCGNCYKNRAYAVDMVTFLLAYNEHLQYVEEKECEQIRNQCWCNNDGNNNNNYQNNNNNYQNNNNNNNYQNNNQQQCWNNCYKQAEKYSCIQYDQDDFELEDYLMCKEMDYYPSGYANYQVNKQNGAGYYNDPDNAYDNGVYYVGPYCKDWNAIYLGTFLEGTCSYAAAHATFASSYLGKDGETFPYFQTPIIASGKCIMCEDEDEYFNEQEQANDANGQQNAYNQNQNNGYYQNQNQNNGYYQNQNNNYYQNQNNNYQQEQQQDEKAVNGVCAFAADDGGDDVISCVYQGDGNENYDGCLFLEVLKDLDGRNSQAISFANNKLKMQRNYTVILGVLAALLVMVIGAITFCDPTAIDEKRSSLLEDAGPQATVAEAKSVEFPVDEPPAYEPTAPADDMAAVPVDNATPA